MNRDSESTRSKTPEKRRRRAARRKKVVRELDMSTVGMVFPIALLLGYFGGGLVGEWFGSPELGSWIGLGFGLLSGFYNLFKVAMVMQKREQEAVQQDNENSPTDGSEFKHR